MLFDHTKLSQLNLLHFFVDTGMLPSCINLLHHVLCFFLNLTVLILISTFIL